MYDEGRAGDLAVGTDLRRPDGDVALRVEGGRLSAEPGRLLAPEAVAAGDQNALRPVRYTGRPVAAAVADRSLRIEGDEAALARLAAVGRSPDPMRG